MNFIEVTENDIMESKYVHFEEGKHRFKIMGKPETGAVMWNKQKLNIPIEYDGKPKIWTINKSKIKLANGKWNIGIYAELARLEAENGELLGRTIEMTIFGTGLNKHYAFKVLE